MIAAFLGLRLYSVLGKRTGHEQEPVLPRRDERIAIAPPRQDVRDAATPAQPRQTVYEPEAEIGVRALLAADRSFDVGRFLTGAQAAYRMILEAFWTGDRVELRELCDDDVYAAFDLEIAAREQRGETLENRLVAVESANIVSADLAGTLARIAVRFDADIAAVTRDADSNVVGGSLSDGLQTHDVWTFSRDLSSHNPNWLLDETDAD